MSVAALLQAKHLVGYDPEVSDNLHFMSEQSLVYASGAVLVVYNTDQHTQKLIGGAAHNKHIAVLQISPNHQFLAVAERGTASTSAHAHIGIGIYDLSTLKKCKTLVSGKVQQQQQQHVLSKDSTSMSSNSRRVTLKFTSIAFSHDNRYLIGQATEPHWTLVYWEWESNKVVATTSIAQLQQHGATPVRQVAFHPHDDVQVIVLGVGGCYILRLEEGNVFKMIAIRQSTETSTLHWCFTFASDTRLLLGCEGGKIILFEGGGEVQPKQFNLIKMTSDDTNLLNFEIVPEDEIIEEQILEENDVKIIIAYSKGFACCCGSDIVYLFERYGGGSIYRQAAAVRIPKDDYSIGATPGTETAPSSIHRIVALTISPSEDVIAIATDRRRIYTFTLNSVDINKSASPTFEPLTSNFHCGKLRDIDVCIRKPIAVTCANDRTIAVWNYNTNQLQLFRQLDDDVLSVALHPTGVYLLVGCSAKLYLMGLMIDDVRLVHEFPVKECHRCSFSNGGHYIAAVHGSAIVVFSTITFDMVSNFKGHVGKILSMSWTLNDLKLVSGGSDGVVIEWDVHSTKRLNEVSLKGRCCNHVAVSNDNCTSFVVGSDGTIREVAESQILGELVIPTSSPLTSVVAMRTGKALFVSSGQGVVWVVGVPLTNQEDWQEFQPINVNIVNMKLTPDDKWLLSVSDDGTLGIWKVTDKEGRCFKADEELSFLEEILITRADLEEKNLAICELSQQARDLRSQLDLQKRTTEQEYIEKSRRLTSVFQKKIDTLEEAVQNLQNDNERRDVTHKETLQSMEENHRLVRERMQSETHQKLVLEYQKYSELQTLGERQCEAIRRQLDDVLSDKESSLHLLTVQKEDEIKRMFAKINTLEVSLVEASQKSEVMVRLVEEDADSEIQDLIASHTKQLADERETNASVKAETGILKQKIINLQKEGDRQREELLKGTTERQRLEQLITTLKTDNQLFKSEINNRDSLLETKEEHIAELRRRNTELDKLRIFLELKLDELKHQLEPATKRAQEAEEQSHKTNAELNRVNYKNSQLDFVNKDLKAKLGATNSRLKEEAQKTLDAKTISMNLRREMGEFCDRARPIVNHVDVRHQQAISRKIKRI